MQTNTFPRPVDSPAPLKRSRIERAISVGSLVAATMLLSAAPAAAEITTIDFNTDFGNRLDGTYSEGGYTTSTYAGDVIYAGDWPGGKTFVRSSDAIPGTAGQVTWDSKGFPIGVHTGVDPNTGGVYKLFDDLTFGGGILDVKADNGSQFTFSSVDYNWFSYGGQIDSGKVTLTAYLDGVQQGALSFTSPRTSYADDYPFTGYANSQMSRYGSDPYYNAFGTGSLDGILMDELRVTLPANYRNGFPGEFELVDNLVLNGVDSPVPEPATWSMMLLGFGVVGVTMRLKRNPVLAGA